MAVEVTTFETDINRLIVLIEANLFYIAKQPMTREKAIEINQRFSRPISVLRQRNQLVAVRPNSVDRPDR